ncbi:TIGR00153 family protein, partial [Candidatus Aerophobetes bacterium Ae_b3a]
MFFKKETKVQELIQKHVQVVGEAVNSWKEAFSCYLEENKEDFQVKTSATIELESKADDVRREAQLILYEGAYLPVFREDLLDLLELTDNVA